jgi:hypothetical protein
MKTTADFTHGIYGLLCWGVTWDSQLNLSMSFGDPILRIREPYVSKSRSPRLREHASYRQVRVRGKWWLWILCARWKLTISRSLFATGSSSQRKRKLAMARLDGQRLTMITIEPLTGATEFGFDLGATLRVRRLVADDSDIWTLYKPNGYVLGIRGDGTCTHAKGTTPEDELKAKKIKTPNKAPEPTPGSVTPRATHELSK